MSDPVDKLKVRGRRRVWWAVLLFSLAACTSKPPPTPMSLRAPAPPGPLPGSIRIYGQDLAESREKEIDAELRRIEPEVLAAYESYLANDASIANSASMEGRLQIKLGINADGKVASMSSVYSEVGDDLIAEVRGVLRRVHVSPGPEAWVFDTFRFQRDSLEVLRIGTDFGAKPPVVLALVENRSTFHVPAVSATVTVLGPEKAKPLRIYRRKLKDDFSPGDRHELRIPIDGEWATARNSFLVVVRPTIAAPVQQSRE
jgi:hypothetical protein